ncbi:MULTISPECIES: 2Fe-2S iron-sulfur cluster-binding protein [unclassified Pseudonocardia]|uniref:2Fe-2S iron-sulfur cluster-binding protein n=1 Tax=unclassified Pseudonocardia TaxID=2619320 RepID=UPI00095D8DC3|nr:2Fe-2S iron-sulfur cluster-binding protein [Pseudonocardia sp. Ae707_Ps1]OLM18701.1 NADH-ubiquinone oxidoreductase chain G2, Formate dehydrogenase putative subunit [Pseudonocardia sp. Ae707_Ps1]
MTTTSGKGPAGPGGGSRAPAPGQVDGAPEADAGANGSETPGDGPGAGEGVGTLGRTNGAGAVGVTVADPAGAAPGPAERLSGGPVMLGPIRRTVGLSLDGTEVRVPEGSTILEALHSEGTAEQADTPTLCWAPNMDPINACRVCVVEVEGSRTLVPSCARRCEDGMEVRTGTEKVWHSRRMVLELLASSVDMDRASDDVQRWMREYGVDAERYGPPDAPAAAGERDRRHPGHHHAPDGRTRATVEQPVKIDNDLYVRDYSRCIMCYKCVNACGTDAQFTFAIAAAGRGFDARIATEHDVELPDSACVYCGNCIGVCPTGALVSVAEHDRREAGDWHPDEESVTTTICSFCGVGCNLELHVQRGEIVNVTSPADHSVTHGHLCIKGRFGFRHVQNLPEDRPS